ncbi:glycosyltransferase family 2 protein [bacterium]|nr:glycosyltransferase family 2 protein [bacterium]
MNRPQTARHALEMLRSQHRVPDEVILVEAGEHRFQPQTGEAWPFRLQRLQSTAGMAVQRNLGLESATGDILTFLDDDAVLDKQYCEVILDAFSAEVDVVGIGGVQQMEARSEGLELLFRKIFLLQTDRGRNRFLCSGFPDFNIHASAAGDAGILPSTVLSFRAEAARDIRFDPALFSGRPLDLETGRCFGEDAWFTSELSQRGRLRLLASARYSHVPDPRNRENSTVTQALYVYAMRQLSYREAKGLRRRLCRAWALAGLALLALLQSIRYANTGYVRGYGMAMRKPLHLMD